MDLSLSESYVAKINTIVSLVIMVKNEGKVIVDTMKPLVERGGIHNILIYDTGSEDNTIQVCKDYFKEKKLNGIVHQGPWLEYGETRNAVLDLGKKLFSNESTFLLMIDSEWYAQNPEALIPFCEKHKDDPADIFHSYCLDGETGGGTEGANMYGLFRISSASRYTGPIHEYVSSGGSMCLEYVMKIKYAPKVYSTERWYRDLGKLFKEYQNTKNPRWLFYFAQTFHCLCDTKHALINYKKRAEISEGNLEEQYISLYRVAKIYDTVKEFKNWNKALTYYMRAHQHSPHRAEPIIMIAMHYPQPAIKYMYIRRACNMQIPTISLFVDYELYNFNRWEELSIGAWYETYEGNWQEGYNAIKKAVDYLLAKNVNPNNIRGNLKLNFNIYANKLGLPSFEQEYNVFLLKAVNISKEAENIKLFNLIVFSEREDYNQMKELLRGYFKNKNIRYYFCTFSPNIEEEWSLEDNDTITFKGEESFIPGILNKTIKALEICDREDYDYVVRTNISSIINFDILREELFKTPLDYSGPLYYDRMCLNPNMGITEDKSKLYASHHWIAGICIVLSRKAVKMILEDREKILSYGIVDDVAVGIYFHQRFINEKDLTRGVLGHKLWEMNNSTFVPGKIVYRNKFKNLDHNIDTSVDRVEDIKNMKMIVLHLLNTKDV